MSRILGFDLSNKSPGEFVANWSRGWMVNGNTATAGGGQSQIIIPASVAGQPWLGLGKMLYSKHPKLPASAGVIDTPWGALLPASMTVYSIEYLLSIRVPDEPVQLHGSVFEIAAEIVALANAQEELFLRIGNTSGDDSPRTETLDQRTFWEQLNALVARAGLEMTLRPVREADSLVIYVDILQRVGRFDPWELHDGINANMQIIDARLDGKIINRMIGTSSQSTSASRLTTPPMVNQDSIDAFRLRSDVPQFRGVVEESTLLAHTSQRLAVNSWPQLVIRANIIDVNDTFLHLAQGNALNVHASQLYFPDGIRAWRGRMRMMVLAYEESNETVAVTMSTPYYGQYTES